MLRNTGAPSSGSTSAAAAAFAAAADYTSTATLSAVGHGRKGGRGHTHYLLALALRDCNAECPVVDVEVASLILHQFTVFVVLGRLL
eukprot:125919-Rhodomonas_salina.1